MLRFKSASARIANSVRAVDELVEIAFGEDVSSEYAGTFIVNAAIGHKLDVVGAQLYEKFPKATVLGASCGGVVGKEGAGETLSHIALMAIEGSEKELASAAVDEIYAANAYEKALVLAKDLYAKIPDATVIYLLCAGKDINCDLVLKAFDEVYGQQPVIFGGTASDNYKAITTYQYIGDTLTEHGAWAVGMADPTLKVATKATHGFMAYGEPMRVTKAEGNKVIEIDDMPAWAAYSHRLSLIPDEDNVKQIMTIGGLAQELPPELAEEYGNTHILRGAGLGRDEGTMYMSVSVTPGEEFWLTTRNEDLIFSEQEKALVYLQEELHGKAPIAVFQADCLARGRTLFNKVMKDEIISMMQDALQAGEDVPPWLGMYGFGEFCPLGGRNAFHTYTTSLMVLYRD